MWPFTSHFFFFLGFAGTVSSLIFKTQSAAQALQLIFFNHFFCDLIMEHIGLKELKEFEVAVGPADPGWVGVAVLGVRV